MDQVTRPELVEAAGAARFWGVPSPERRLSPSLLLNRPGVNLFDALLWNI
jgi:hypothetical protein